MSKLTKLQVSYLTEKPNKGPNTIKICEKELLTATEEKEISMCVSVCVCCGGGRGRHDATCQLLPSLSKCLEEIMVADRRKWVEVEVRGLEVHSSGLNMVKEVKREDEGERELEVGDATFRVEHGQGGKKTERGDEGERECAGGQWQPFQTDVIFFFLRAQCLPRLKGFNRTMITCVNQEKEKKEIFFQCYLKCWHNLGYR